MSQTRPRPKPRPRPLAKSSEPSATQGSSSSNTLCDSSPPPQQLIEEEDEDASFMKNRSRTAMSWKKLEKMTQKTANVSSSDEEHDDTEATPKMKKKLQHENTLPNWTRNKNLVRLLSEELEDDDDEDEVQEVEYSADGHKSGKHAKRKRPRSRSRSITPPPELPSHLLQNARNVVRQTLDTAPRPASPTLFATETRETTILDPELEKIAREVRSGAAQSSTINFAVLPENAGGPETVIITVKWRPHPLNQAGRANTWLYKMRRNDTFKQLFEETADEASIPSNNLIISCGGKRLFSSATPNSLKIWSAAELEACDANTFEYLRANRTTSQNPIPSNQDEEDSERSATASPTHGSAAESDAESAGGDKMKLIFRSALTSKDIALTVRPTTTCGAIVKAFLKAAGLADKYQSSPVKGKGKKASSVPMLAVDGDKLDASSAIGDADLEDGDLVEVVGL